jgi:hypothetical protein
MGDTEEDITGDLAAAVRVCEDLHVYDALCDNFQRAWGKFEDASALFFEHIDVYYRTQVVTPILPNLEANIEKLRQKGRPPFTDALAVLETVHRYVIKGPSLFQYIEQSVYRHKAEKKFYICVYAKQLFVSIPHIKALTDKCNEVSSALKREYLEYRGFEQDLQLLLITYLKRKGLSPESSNKVPRLFQVLCGVLTANLLLENKISAGFVTCDCEDTMDIVFKPTPVTCRTYDLMKSMSKTIHEAREELQGAITEAVGVTKKQQLSPNPQIV